MVKNIKCFLLIIVMFTLCFYVFHIDSVSAADGDFKIEDGVLIQYYGSANEVIIPDGVTVIGDEAFDHCTSLTSVTIPGSITEIRFEAFHACTRLSNVTFFNGVTTIGNSAFAGCTSLTSIIIPNTVTEIEAYAFWGCTNLTDVTVGDGMLSIGYKAFADCTNLSIIDISEKAVVASSAFMNTKVKEVGGILTTAGMMSKLSSLCPEVVKLEDISQVASYSDVKNWPFPQSKELVFGQMKDLVKQLIIGKSSETEKAKVIYDWISQNITYDLEAYNGNAYYTFYYRTGVCSGYANLAQFMFTMAGLSSVQINYYAHSISDSHAWNAVYADGRWIMLDATWGIWDIPFNYHQNASEIIFQNGIFLEIFRNDGSVECQFWSLDDYPSSVIVPNGVTHITFISMDRLSSIVLPDTLTKIDSCAFERCTNLTNVTIPDSVTQIGNRGFMKCTSLTDIPVSDNIIKIGSQAFSGCTGLTSIIIPDSVTEIGWAAFSNCTNLTDVTIPSSVTKIDMSAFFSCTKLRDVVIANGDTEIGDLAFCYAFNSSGESIMKDLTIYSMPGGKVERYCKERGISFTAIDGELEKVPTIDLHNYYIKCIAFPHISGISNVSSGFKIEWDAISNATGYYVYRKIGSESWKKVKTTSSTFWIDKKAKINGTEYQYKIFAYNKNAISSSSPARSIYYLDTPEISKIENISSCKLVLCWNKNDEATGYQIKYKTNSQSKIIVVDSYKTEKRIIENLRKGEKYKIYIRSYKIVSGVKYYSPWSNVKVIKIRK